MKGNRAAVLVGVFVLGGFTCLHGQEGMTETPYYPLKVNTRWDYQVKGQNTTITMKVAKHEKVGDVMCAVIETIVNNNVVATEHVRADKEGVKRYMFMGQKADPPVLFLKLPYKKGDKWTVDTKVMGQATKGTFQYDEEVVDVKQGKHKTIVARSNDFEAAGQKVSTTYWFAEGVGMVKQQANIAGTDVTLELTKFEMP